MAEKRKEPSQNESSLLFQYSAECILNNENLLMPINTDSGNVNSDKIEPPDSGDLDSNVVTPRSTTLPTDQSGPRYPPPLCQLQQPLHFGGMLQPFKTDMPTLQAESGSHTTDITESLQNLNVKSTNIEESQYQGDTPLFCTVESSQPPALSYFPLSESTSLDEKAAGAEQPSGYYKVHGSSHYEKSTAAVVEPMNQSYPTTLPSSYASVNIQKSLPLQSNFQYQFNANRAPYSTSLVETLSSCKVEPVKPYWMFQDTVESKEIWYGFSEKDSLKLESCFQQGVQSIVATDGGRYDVDIKARLRKSVYFEAKDLHVRRCTWFYKHESSIRFKPYDERTAEYLEAHYAYWAPSGLVESRFVVPDVEGSFLFEKPMVLLHYGIDVNTWTTPNDPKNCPRTIKRGLPDGFQIMPSQSDIIDHLLFVVQGIGSFCDLRFRTVSECVDGVRDIANQLVSSHFTKAVEQQLIGRVEILPVAWHSKLRHNEIRLDRTMQRITLPSIPKLRHFTNDTLIDILLYSSSSYSQSIISTVSGELNTIYNIFLDRNPNFTGKVFVAGHSLGSLILFDILSNQRKVETTDSEWLQSKFIQREHFFNILKEFKDIKDFLENNDLIEYMELFENQKVQLWMLQYFDEMDYMRVGLPVKAVNKIMHILYPDPIKHASSLPDQLENPKADTGAESSKTTRGEVFQGPISGKSSMMYPRLSFHPAAFFALGSPISMFLAVRGFDSISEEYSFPTCPAFFHIFHPYDPVAFRIEPMINHKWTEKPYLIPHHKGRKRMHLEIKENVAKFAMEFRQKVMDTVSKTCNSIYEMTGLQPFQSAIMEAEVEAMISKEVPEISDEVSDQQPAHFSIGKLNGGRRIDYVLQEKPLEAINDYVWALTSHATYWDSEDTVLMILKEIYRIQGIDMSLLGETVPEVLSSENKVRDNLPSAQTENGDQFSYPSFAQAATVPISESSNVPPKTAASVPGSKHIGPPPLSGFVKKSAFSRNE